MYLFYFKFFAIAVLYCNIFDYIIMGVDWTASQRICFLILEIYVDPAAVDALTHGGRDKMAVIFQTTFSNTFS